MYYIIFVPHKTKKVVVRMVFEVNSPVYVKFTNISLHYKDFACFDSIDKVQFVYFIRV